MNTIETMRAISDLARKVNERLSYHFADTSGGWNVPKEMPLMQEFLNEVRTLCDLCFAAEPDDKTKNAQFSGRTYENIVSSYFFYMWTFWKREECNLVFGRESEHFWQKWCHYAEPSAAGAAEKFYSALSVNNRRKLVDRACTVYDGDSLVTIDPTLPQKPKVSGILNMLTGVLNDWWNYQDYETRQSISNLTDEGFGSLDEHDRAMNDNWKRLLVEEKLTLWRQFWNKNESDMTPELLAKISSHLHNLTQIDQHNELSLIFMDEQKRHEIDMQPWIDEWHACECDFAVWYAGLPQDMQRKVMDYYRTQKSL